MPSFDRLDTVLLLFLLSGSCWYFNLLIAVEWIFMMLHELGDGPLAALPLVSTRHFPG